MKTVKEIDDDYDSVIFSMSLEPVWIFFAGWYEYPPEKWHQGFPMDEKELDGFGGVSYIDKYHFGRIIGGLSGIYDLHNYIDDKTLYIANAIEVGENLITKPGGAPPGLKLIKAVSYPSGEPVFYLFEKTK